MGKTTTSPASTEETTREFAPSPEITADNIGDVKTGEPIYTAAELATAARAKFGTSPEVVAAALKTANKEKATLDEAAAIVKAFLEREVR